MKSVLNCRSLIRVAVIIVVMAFMASQVTDTFAGRNNNKCMNGNHSYNKKGKCKRCKKIIRVIVNNNTTTGGGSNDHEVCCDEILSKLDEILGNGNGTGPRCNVCPPPEGVLKSYVPMTGQKPRVPLDPSPTGSDGDLGMSVTWPNPRFKDKEDGTVTDNLTCLVWTKDANCADGTRNWSEALSDCNSLASGSCGLTDSSVAVDWRLPNVRELHSLIHFGVFDPAVPPHL